MTRADTIWTEQRGDSPLVATAIHHGHELREEAAALAALSPEERLREEDPFTGEWAALAPTWIVVQRSRFEIDLNRPRDKAVYLRPEDAWGLDVWRELPPPDLVERSLAAYDAFYAHVRQGLDGVVARHGRFVLLDVHSYNHRRAGPDGPAADPEGNPQVNVGTGTMERARWASLVDRFLAELSAGEYAGAKLDVRENVRFRGGNLARWVHESYPDTGCALALEFKKTFMDEWTGVPDRARMDEIGKALSAALPGLVEELRRT